MAKKSKHLIAPADIAGNDDAAGEWSRIIAAIEKCGRKFKPADRSILILHCSTWAMNQQCRRHVEENGMTIQLPNLINCASPEYKMFTETLKLLRGTLADLGCTPAARGFDAAKSAASAQPPPIEF